MEDIMIYNKIVKYINSYNRVTINEMELRNLSYGLEYLDYYNAIINLIEDKRIVPVKSSGSNGMNPPLHKRYTILKDEKSYQHLIDEIRLLDSCFNIKAYLDQPSQYAEHREFIIQFDKFIKTRSNDLEIEASINERSFQIFNLEKAIKHDRTIKSILNLNTRLAQKLNFYNTPEPFFTHYVSSEDKNLKVLNILIIENKDTWYTLSKLLSLEKRNIFGIDFHILLYGEGKKIVRTSSSLTDFTNVILDGQECIYYYFGDLDYEGINIFNNLVQNNKELDIRLMSSLYVEMIRLSKRINLPDTKELQRVNKMDDFLKQFNEENVKCIKMILQDRKYVPQEIISYIEFSKFITAGD